MSLVATVTRSKTIYHTGHPEPRVRVPASPLRWCNHRDTMANRMETHADDSGISARSVVVFLLEALAFAIVGGLALIITTQYIITGVGTPDAMGMVLLVTVPGLMLAGTHRAINHVRGG